MTPEGGTEEYPLIFPAHVLRVVVGTQGGPVPGRAISIDVSQRASIVLSSFVGLSDGCSHKRDSQ